MRLPRQQVRDQHHRLQRADVAAVLIHHRPGRALHALQIQAARQGRQAHIERQHALQRLRALRHRAGVPRQRTPTGQHGHGAATIGQHAPRQLWRLPKRLAHQRQRGLDIKRRRRLDHIGDAKAVHALHGHAFVGSGHPQLAR